MTDTVRRSDALYYDTTGVNRRALCDMVAQREHDIDELHGIVRDALAVVNNAQRGFSVHPKQYRDLYSRAKKMGVDLS